MAITHLPEVNTANAAEHLAKLGFIGDPQLWTGTAGAIHLHDAATGKIRQTINMAQKKRTIWPSVLAALSSQGIDVSADWCKEPFEASINDTVGILWDNKGVTVSAWIKDGTEAGEGEICVGGKVLYPLAEPIRIDFEDGELSTAFVDVQPNDLFTLDDLDGNPMYEINITTEEREGHHYRRTLLAPSADYIEQHHRLPVPLITTLKGIGITFNHDTLYRYLMDETASPLWQAIHALESKV